MYSFHTCENQFAVAGKPVTAVLNMLSCEGAAEKDKTPCKSYAISSLWQYFAGHNLQRQN